MIRKLRIGQISPLNLPIPPRKYGGSEKIIYYLCEELTKKGHKVFLFGPKESKVNCCLIPIVERSLWELQPKESCPYYAYEMAQVAKSVKKLKIDVLHDHLGPWSLTLYGQVKVPIIHTLHIPFKNKDRIWGYKKLNAKLVSISLAQRKPAADLNYLANIYNGIPVEDFPFNLKPKNYFLWIGELSPRKGVLEVIKIAKMAKIKLILVGRIPPPQQSLDYKFFQKYIKKKLNKGKIKYLGERSFKSLQIFYKNAAAFLFPLQWEEPFGLTMIEAMACGTPVIAYNRGSVPEVVKDKETGFVVNPFSKNKMPNYKGFLEAIKKINQISRKKCREWIEQNFTIKRMVDDYERLFYRLFRK